MGRIGRRDSNDIRPMISRRVGLCHSQLPLVTRLLAQAVFRLVQAWQAQCFDSQAPSAPNRAKSRQIVPNRATWDILAQIGGDSPWTMKRYPRFLP